MRLAIHANGFVLTGSLRRYTGQRLAGSLGWARQHMRKLVASLPDIDGPRGGVDKRCLIQAGPGAGREVIIEDTEIDLYKTIDRAAQRADRAFVRHVQRRRPISPARLARNKAGAAAARDDRADDAGDPAEVPFPETGDGR